MSSLNLRSVLAADLVKVYRDAFDTASEKKTTGLFTSGVAGLLAVYERGVAAQPGWREITRDEITKGMRVRTVAPCGDRTDMYEGIADDEDSGDWHTPEGCWFNTDVSNARIFTPCADALPREITRSEVDGLPEGAQYEIRETRTRTIGYGGARTRRYYLTHLPATHTDKITAIIGQGKLDELEAADYTIEPKARP